MLILSTPLGGITLRVLFILKKNETYGFTTYTRRSSGLFNSTSFIVQGLRAREIEANIIEVLDNNDIDREVKAYKPDHVVIEALWVVPEKFEILALLHPTVEWHIHLHSHMPFLALEGIAMNWILRYAEMGINLIANSVESYRALRCILHRDEIVYLPNVYIPRFHKRQKPHQKEWLDVGCFGAIRPLKNQLLQALASIQFARDRGQLLRFHINASRTETGGDPVLKNLVQLFEQQDEAELVQHPWHEPEDFLHYLNENIDVGLQVSLTETFNVVCADYVTAGVPTVASKEVTWLSRFSKACDNSVSDIMAKMDRALHCPSLVTWNQFLLKRHSLDAQERWATFFS